VKIDASDPPRTFQVGSLELKDCGAIQLEPGEQVTFVTPAGGEYDVARTAWGFYATPSVNGRLPRFGLSAVLARNADAKYFVLLVERSRDEEFRRYCEREEISVVAWLDDDQVLATLAADIAP
jgi:hypothetical protein